MDDVESGSSKASTDGDGLPIIDPATKAAWIDEALNTLPAALDFAETLVAIRWAAELDRRGIFNQDLPDGLTAPEQCLRAILALLSQQPDLMKRMDVAPLLRLHAAIVNLADGISPTLLIPKKRAAGRPKGQHLAMIQGVAARTVTELIVAGENLGDATRLVAKAINKGRKDLKGVSAQTVENWRERVMQGPGPGAPSVSVQHYRAALPPDVEDTPRGRANFLLNALKTRGEAIG